MVELKLYGKIVIKGKIETITGLHIGGSSTGLEIGGTDNIVIRDTITRTPYIPGSSLKGKMRNLLEKKEDLAVDDKRIWVVKPEIEDDRIKKEGISIHMCDEKNCSICTIFGRNNGPQPKVNGGEIKITCTTPTRLIVRDALMTPESKIKLEDAETDLPYTEVKWENVIDRVTSAATPRQTERIPAGSEFSFEMIYNIFNQTDVDYLKHVFEAMKLLEDDYLGGQGTRGYGKIEFKDNEIKWRPRTYYEQPTPTESIINNQYKTVKDILQNFDTIITSINLT